MLRVPSRKPTAEAEVARVYDPVGRGLVELWQDRCPPIEEENPTGSGQRPLKLPSLKNTALRLKTLRPSPKASKPSDPCLKAPKDLQAFAKSAKTLGPSLKNTGKLQAFAKCLQPSDQNLPTSVRG